MRTTIKITATAAVLILSIAWIVSTASGQQKGIARLGYRWDVTQDNGWRAIWVRRDIQGAISNQYDATFFHPTYGELRSDMRIHIDVRDGLIIERRDITGPQAGRSCRYIGQLNYAARTASGTASCDWAPNAGRWWATTWR